MRVAVLFLLLAACNKAPARTNGRDAGVGVAPIKDAATVVDVKPIYTKLCTPCHGAEGKGYAADFAPSLVTTTFLESATDDYLRRSILFGRPGTSMGAYGKAMGGPLDDAQIEALVGWIRAQSFARPKPLIAAAAGDAAKGAPLYAEYCKTCHGDQTKRGEAPHLANIQFLTIATDSFIRYAIEMGRPGTKMNAFGQVMTPQQLDDVTAYVRSLASAPATGMLPEPTGKEPIVINPKGKDPTWTPREGKFIGVDDVAKALKEKKRLIILDARPPSDWRRVHIEGAVSMPHYDPKRIDEVLAQKNVYAITYCACPHHLSGLLQEELAKKGYTRALILDEGINVWHQKGYPVTAAEGVQPPPLEPQGGSGGSGR